MTNLKAMIIYRKLTAIIFLNILLIKKVSLQATSKNEKDCIDGPSYFYQGTRSQTKSGIPCQRWDETKPHQPRQIPSDGGHYNYCRNPDNELTGAWCYTMSPSKRWEACDIPKCDVDSKIMWTEEVETSSSSRIVSKSADPEITSNLTVLVSVDKTRGEFRTIAAEFNHQRMLYSDFRSGYLGILHLQNNTSTRAFEGMAHGIESLAHDPVTGNLYWTDSIFKWIMVVEKNLRYYTPIYRTGQSEPYALAIHYKARKLYFSTYSHAGAKLMVIDMVGNNKKVLLKHPFILDVMSLAIDYVGQRLYWTDVLGVGSKIMSSDLDGMDLIPLHYKEYSMFMGVAVYGIYLYFTDSILKVDKNEEYYVLWMHDLHTKKAFKIKLLGKPKGIAVLNSNDTISQDNGNQGICDSNLTPCEQICIPMLNASRQCACALGYQKVGKTKCISKSFEDDFMLVADEGQGQIYQIPFGFSNKSPLNYSIITATEGSDKISVVASDARSGYIYWSDKHHSIQRSLVKGGKKQHMVSQYHATSIVIDPCSKNTFFLDATYQAIYIMRSDGHFLKALMRSNLTKNTHTSIQMLELDIESRKIYWTDTKNEAGKGEVWRMNYDGTNVELVFENLNWPRAITIDYTKQRLFISEAKTAMVYSVSLSSIINITNTSPRSIDRQYDLSIYIEKEKPYISDIKVHKNMLYFADENKHALHRFNLTEGPASTSRFGPHDFYRITSISLFSRNYVTDIGCRQSPCSKRRNACSQLCVDLSDTESQCLCNDGMNLTGTGQNHCLKGNKTSNPPTAGNTCPNDMTLTVSACSDYVIPNWKPPTWSDDETDATALKIQQPILPQRLVIGQHPFAYYATDEDKQTGVCEFLVTVIGPTCGKAPTLPEDMHIISKNICGYKYGSHYLVSCKEPSSSIYQNGFVTKNLTNFCDNSGLWFPFSSFKGIYCKEEPLNKTQSSPATLTNTITMKYFNTSSAVTDVPKDLNTSTYSKTSTVGLIVIVCLLIAIVIIIVAALVYKKTCNSACRLSEVNFPIFWKRKDGGNTSCTNYNLRFNLIWKTLNLRSLMFWKRNEDNTVETMSPPDVVYSIIT